MSGFLYYFVGTKNAPTDEQLKEMKLDHLVGAVFSQSAWGGNEMMEGPGVICAIAQSELAEGGNEPRVGFYPEVQEWSRGGEKWWIGWEKDNRPGPADLIKEDWTSGHEVEMGDGGIWIIPPERFLPDKLELDENMEVQRIPLLQFDGIRKLTAKLNADFRIYTDKRADGEEQPEEQMSGAEQMLAAIFFLGLNYRLGRVEVNNLNLLNDKTLLGVLGAIWDLPAMVKMVKEMNRDDKKKSNLQATADISIVEDGGIS